MQYIAKFKKVAVLVVAALVIQSAVWPLNVSAVDEQVVPIDLCNTETAELLDNCPTPPPPPSQETPPPPPSEELPPPPPPVQEEGCIAGPGYATSVFSENQGTRNNGSAVLAERSNPANALGAPDDSFFSIGKGGEIVLSFAGFPIDISGDDVQLYEITNTTTGSGDPFFYPTERAKVEISQDGVTWVEVGQATGPGVASQDISATGLDWLKYVRLTDANAWDTDFGGSDYETADGYDLDAVYVLFEDCAAATLQKEGEYNPSTGVITYTIDWTVIGDGTVNPLVITDVIPTGTEYIDGSADNGGTFDSLLDTLTWNLGSKNSGTSGSVSFKVEVDASLFGEGWATTVVSFNQGVRKNGTPVLPERTAPINDLVLGAAESLGTLYDNPAAALFGTYASLGFTDEPNGGALTIAFDKPVANGPGNDIKVFEVTGSPNPEDPESFYPDEEIRVEVSDDNSTWTDIGVIVRDGEVDLGSVGTANFVRLTGITDPALFENIDDLADNYDVDAVRALNLIPEVCSIENTAVASWVVAETVVTTTASTETVINKSACDEQEHSISGQKWSDINGDGDQDEGEEGLSGWTIYADFNDNGTLDVGEPSTTTDANGNYSLTGLVNGIYIIREVQQEGYEQTYPNTINQFKHVVFITGSDVTDKDFGNHNEDGGGSGCEGQCPTPPPPGGGGGGNPPPPPSGQGSITGVVFNDVNDNGTKDEGESELSGWVVYLDSNDNGVKDDGEVSDTTESPYLITGLADGTYNVRQVLQGGWTQTAPADKYVVIISGGNAVTGKDFGNHQGTITVSGGGGGGSGGSGGGTPPPPPGQVLGDSTNVPSTGSTPDPIVLGATELPRTGSSLPLAALAPLLIPGLALLKKRFSK